MTAKDKSSQHLSGAFHLPVIHRPYQYQLDKEVEHS